MLKVPMIRAPIDFLVGKVLSVSIYDAFSLHGSQQTYGGVMTSELKMDISAEKP